METEPANTLLRADEVAVRLRFARSTVYRKIQTGELPAIRIGCGPKAAIRVRSDDLERLMPEPSVHGPEFYRPVKIPDGEAVQATATFTLGERFVAKGERLHRNDPLVTAHPGLFQVPARPLDAA